MQNDILGQVHCCLLITNTSCAVRWENARRLQKNHVGCLQ